MMKLTIDGNQYTANTAVEMIERIKELHWHAGAETTPEGYIALQETAYQKTIGRRMILPKADTETRAKAMFRAVAECGAWDYEEGGDRDDNE